MTFMHVGEIKPRQAVAERNVNLCIALGKGATNLPAESEGASELAAKLAEDVRALEIQAATNEVMKTVMQLDIPSIDTITSPDE